MLSETEEIKEEFIEHCIHVDDSNYERFWGWVLERFTPKTQLQQSNEQYLDEFYKFVSDSEVMTDREWEAFDAEYKQFKYRCKKCNGTGEKGCSNPDCNFIYAMGGEIARLGCPECSGKGVSRCDDCRGSGKGSR